MATSPLSPEAREKMLNLPASSPPPNVKPNFVNPSSVAFSAECALHGLYALSTIMFFIKAYAQVWIDRKKDLESCVVAVAWIVYTGAFQPVGVLLARAPMGVHQRDITFRQFGRYLFLQYTLLVIWGILVLLLKITILLQYLRVFVPHGSRNFTFWASHVLLYTNIVYYVAFTFLQIFSCSPREKWWDKTIMEGHCIDIFAVNVSGAVVCLVSDLAILCIPQGVVTKLNLPRSKIVGLCALFAIGVFACVTSAVRVYYNVRLWQSQVDVTHQLSYMSFWGTAQLPAAFLVVCLPSVPKVFNHVRTKPWCARLETWLRPAAKVPAEKAPTARQIVTIGGGANGQQKATVVSDAEFRDLMATDRTSVSTTSHVHTMA
ncbi:hypothetical protein PG985_014794 [Apiospora marii]|uniref:Rhodopsin domain-containing protein n=1 Tax=Apiospora marii TaxID=335849 RepID=A0ABR1RJ80_9PEZI